PIVIRDTRIVGDAVELLRSRSLPTASMRFHRSSKLHEIVISETGNARSPFSIQKPPAPREKSPVTGLKPKPIMSVTYRPRSTPATIDCGDAVPACSMKFDVVGPGAPPMPRP